MNIAQIAKEGMSAFIRMLLLRTAPNFWIG